MLLAVRFGRQEIGLIILSIAVRQADRTNHDVFFWQGPRAIHTNMFFWPLDRADDNSFVDERRDGDRLFEQNLHAGANRAYRRTSK